MEGEQAAVLCLLGPHYFTSNYFAGAIFQGSIIAFQGSIFCRRFVIRHAAFQGSKMTWQPCGTTGRVTYR